MSVMIIISNFQNFEFTHMRYFQHFYRGQNTMSVMFVYILTFIHNQRGQDWTFNYEITLYLYVIFMFNYAHLVSINLFYSSINYSQTNYLTKHAFFGKFPWLETIFSDWEIFLEIFLEKLSRNISPDHVYLYTTWAK